MVKKIIKILVGIPVVLTFGLLISILNGICYLFKKEESKGNLMTSIVKTIFSGISLFFTSAFSELFYGDKISACKESASKDVEFTPEEKFAISLQDKANFSPLYALEESYKEIKEEIEKNQKTEKVKALMLLRDHSFMHNFTFVGIMSSCKFTNFKLEDYEQDKKLPEFYLVQKVDFGYNINKALSTVCGVELKKVRRTGETYVVLKDGIVFNMEDMLSRLLMNPVKIKFIDKTLKTAKIK